MLGALFERLHVRDASAAEREEEIWALLDDYRDAAQLQAAETRASVVQAAETRADTDNRLQSPH